MSVFAPRCVEGRVAFVTGGATGIGFGIAATLARAGAKVAIASRKAENLEAAASRIADEGGAVLPIRTDVRSYEEVEAAVARTVEHFGGLDAMIANAAGNFVVPTAEMTPKAWRVVIDIDLNGTFNCSRAAFSHLAESRFGGRLVAISTMRALEGWPGCAHAAAAKAGIISLMRTLASEWGPHGIRCNTVAPGPIEGTEGVRRIYEEKDRLEQELASVPLGRFGTVSEISDAVLYLVSDAGGYVTGCDLVVDGGRSRHRTKLEHSHAAGGAEAQ